MYTIFVEWFVYDPITGALAWAQSPRSQTPIGALAGSQDIDGYWRVKFRGRRYLTHRIAILLQTGAWPEGEVDHIDRDPGNNRWENLRDATCSQNRANRGLQRNNSSGIKGVSRCGSRWRAQVGREYLGLYTTPEAAARAAAVRAQQVYKAFAYSENK
jgi:hypothetical protein